jgi:hypothetical protein
VSWGVGGQKAPALLLTLPQGRDAWVSPGASELRFVEVIDIVSVFATSP